MGNFLYSFIFSIFSKLCQQKLRFKSLFDSTGKEDESGKAEEDPETTWQINHARKLGSTQGL